ncbi:phosphotransferase [Testudinibacter sp. P80/BLE/0925]|uniref:phosphotransferase n=1 Tax=Testudinibacter sp. TW-1 TaxID=3417757 RepID=UPI003D368FE5
MKSLTETINQVLSDNKAARVVSFYFGNKKYWLKQTERTRGFMRLLKTNPQQALRHEVQALQYLNKVGAPCAKLVEFGDDYLVLQDVGMTANQWLHNTAFDQTQKQRVLNDCAVALAELHRLDLVHGRPATRDMGWDNGKVRFIDFESKLDIRRLQWNKIRDLLIFIHDLYRNGTLSQTMIESAVAEYRRHGGETVWRQAIQLVNKRRMLYCLFKPFYPIAGKDLLASLKLFEYLLGETSV